VRSSAWCAGWRRTEIKRKNCLFDWGASLATAGLFDFQ
jgi:hypothetical protein